MTTRHRKRIKEAQTVADRAGVLLEVRRAGLLAASARLAEAGRVLSAANEDKLRSAQAAIDAVLASLSDAEAEESARESALRLAEAYSAAAADAATGAWIASNLLDLMSEESDEPGELGVLALAFQALQQWILMEVSTIGSPDDVEDSASSGLAMWGFEAIRKRLEAEPISAPEVEEAAKCATCEGSGTIRDGHVECPDCSGSGEAKKESRATAAFIRDLFANGDDPSSEEIEVAFRRHSNALKGAKAPGQVRIREGKRLVGDLVPLVESSVKEDGSTAIKLIQPGWGSTGYYSAEVLEAGAGVFAAGTKMFWDHPTVSEEWERRERSLRDLAAELTSDAVYEADGPAGPGLYADAKVFDQYRATLNEIAPSIGVSIVAYGKAENGTAEGKSGQLITELVAADSVDFVTYPGAGGQVLSLFEAARQRPLTPPKEEAPVEIEKDPKFVEVAQRAARAEEALVLRVATDVVATKLAESELPEITRQRLAASLAANPPAKDGVLDQPALEARIQEAINAEIEYLAGLNKSGQIRGMGNAQAGDEDLTPQLEAAFKGIGLNESAAKLAAAGRTS